MEKEKNNINTINVPKLKRTLYELIKSSSSSPTSANSVFASDQIEIIADQLQASGAPWSQSSKEEDWFVQRKDKMEELVTWKLIYTTSKGQSGGNLGPLKGQVYQEVQLASWIASGSKVTVSPRLVNRLAFFNSFFKIDGDADIVLDQSSNSNNNINNKQLRLNFRDTLFFVGDFQIAKVPTPAQATLEIIYDDDDIRILRFVFDAVQDKQTTPSADEGVSSDKKSSIFVLEKIKK